MWRLTKVTDQVLRLDLGDSRLPITEKTITLHRETSPLLHHRIDARGRAAAFDAKLAETIAALDAADASPELGERATGALLRDRGFSASNSVLREAIKVRRLDLGEMLPPGAPECAETETAQQ